MSIKITCSTCQTVAVVPDDAAGKSGKCRQCGAKVHVPATPVTATICCSVCGGDFNYADVVEVGRTVKCRNCLTAEKQFHGKAPVAKVDPSPQRTADSPPIEGNADSGSLQCPICGGLFPITRMDASGTCSRCAESPVVPRKRIFSPRILAVATVAASLTGVLAFYLIRQPAKSEETSATSSATPTPEQDNGGVASKLTPAEQADAIAVDQAKKRLLQYARAELARRRAYELVESQEKLIESHTRQVGALGAATDADFAKARAMGAELQNYVAAASTQSDLVTQAQRSLRLNEPPVLDKAIDQLIADPSVPANLRPIIYPLRGSSPRGTGN